MDETHLQPAEGTLPTGTVTFLYTDVEGSTRLWQEYPAVLPRLIARHDAILRQVVEVHGGFVFRTMGDAICAAFPIASEALAAAVNGQRALYAEPWAEGITVRVRMALHSGAADVREGDYVGHTLNRVARLVAAGHGGQILLSGATYELVRDHVPPQTEIHDLGAHRLKDLVRPEHIYQVLASDLPAAFPPLRTVDAHPTNLPAEPTSFVGRERETRDVVSLLRRTDVRLVTLTGPGGTGKTRLSLRAGAMLLGDFPDGVFFVSLGSITDPALLAATIAATLGVQDVGGQPLETTLLHFLHDKRLLLLLDNFEQVIDGSALVAELLSATPHLKILVTSRSVLRISAEHDYVVPPLAIPDLQHLPMLETLSQYEAVSLFIQRAQAAKPDFLVTNENAPAVAEICARLDGLPLAIELAAARVRLFPPQSLLRRLESRLQTLTGGARDLPARQQTLRGALDWSYSLLSEEEKRLFARLAIFAGSWTLEAVDEVCNVDGALDLVGGVESLVEQSLVRQQDRAGEPRFAMLQTIREYATEKLRETGEADRLRERHAAYFVRLVDAQGSLEEFLGGNTVQSMELIDEANEDIRAALAAALEHGDAETALSFSGTLAAAYWYNRGYWNEGKRWLEGALALPTGNELAGLRAHALIGIGILLWLLNDYTNARARLEEGITLAGPNDPSGVFASVVLGWVAAAEGDLPAAQRLMDGAVVAARRLAAPWLIGAALHSVAGLEISRHEYDDAAAHLQQALAIANAHGQAWMSGYMRNTLGDLARLRGQHAEAEHHYIDALRNFEATKNANGQASATHNLGYVALHNGAVEHAAERFAGALGIFRQLGDQRGVAECLIGLAAVAAARQKPEQAARLDGIAARTFHDLGAVQPQSNVPDSEEYLAKARNQIPEEVYRAAWEAGWAMDLEDGVLYALRESGPMTEVS